MNQADLLESAKIGESLDSVEANLLEKALTEDESDSARRAQLLGFYFRKAGQTAKQSKRADHICWFIRNRPESPVLRAPYGAISRSESEAANNKIKFAWLKLKPWIESVHCTDNAVSFFICNGDLSIAIEVVKHAKACDAASPHWPYLLARIHRLAAETGDAESWKLSLQECQLGASLDEIPMSIESAHIPKLAIESGLFPLAKKSAYKQLDLAQSRKFKDSEIPIARLLAYGVLGRLALHEGNVIEAKRFLDESLPDSVSIALMLTEPEVSLAKELLRAGEAHAVVSYLKRCERVWEKDLALIRFWCQAIEGAQVPHGW